MGRIIYRWHHLLFCSAVAFFLCAQSANSHVRGGVAGRAACRGSSFIAVPLVENMRAREKERHAKIRAAQHPNIKPNESGGREILQSVIRASGLSNGVEKSGVFIYRFNLIFLSSAPAQSLLIKNNPVWNSTKSYFLFNWMPSARHEIQKLCGTFFYKIALNFLPKYSKMKTSYLLLLIFTKHLH